MAVCMCIVPANMEGEMKGLSKDNGQADISTMYSIYIFIDNNHIIMSLGNEVNAIRPNGILVDVDGHKIHVYAEGEKVTGQPWFSCRVPQRFPRFTTLNPYTVCFQMSIE